ncbi:hypothetical protein IW261DRAFT_1498858 [Armillaria novae-zelandiae]|uniref:DUF6534 domain-containing protein n=1 Tax=Armillaria novae-zelandiae TaxID=153914 RepID=A0AA39NZ87_9AGAR|nr:hypothetical protein IW261DRAFT_1498858 [Armillaria novae-zelandiae]
MSSQPSKDILGETLGALYVGSTVATVLFGITNLQTIIYYKKYPRDWWVYRYSVAVLWILDALHVALTTHALYFYLVDMSGDLAGALVHSVWSFKVQLDTNVLIVVYVQGLYAIRLWKLGRHFHKFLPWLVFLAVAASLGAGIFVIYDIFMTSNFSVIATIKASIYTVFTTVAVTDFVIALMMCYYLHKSRAATNFSSTASLLLNLMRLIVVSGLATSACSLLTLISFIMWPNTLIFLGIDFVLPKLYANSLLAMFNYRPEHLQSSIVNSGQAGLSPPAVLCIAPQTFEGSNSETNVSIPLSEIQDIRLFEDKLDRSKRALDDQV